jgi:heat shock protein HtpX
MGIALVPIVLWYFLVGALLVAFGIGAALSRSWDNLIYMALFAVGGPGALRQHLQRSESVALKAARAKQLEPGEEPGLQELVGRVAAQADLPAPRVALVHSARAINAFSVGLNERRAVVAFTTGLLRHRLTRGELEAVVAHELAHVANRDGVVMTFVSAPALVGSRIWHADDWRAKVFFVLIYWPFFFMGLLAMWALSRYREFVADRGAALITGAPEQLMSALQKIAGETARGDLRGGLAVQALCIVPARRERWRRFELFSDHPPLEKRLARLAELARELGKAA